MEATSTRDQQADPEQRKAQLSTWASEGYDGPQPWDHQALGYRSDELDLEPGEPNTVTPTITHDYPILTSGSAHPVIHELGRKLGQLGFRNSVSEGKNPFGHVDATVLAAVEGFRDRYNVREDPTGFGGNTPAGRANANAHIGPWTIEGILAAHRRHQESR